MLRLIYENSLLVKVKIVQILLEEGGGISKEDLLTKLTVTSVTLEKYLKELHTDLPEHALEFEDNNVFFDEKKCSIKEVQVFYFSKSISRDILITCFFDRKMSFERLAQSLYISSSKLFNVLKFLNTQLTEINIQINRVPYICIKGEAESVLVLYHLILQTMGTSYEKSFSKLDKQIIADKVQNFLLCNHITVENWLIEELILWVITVNDRFFLRKFLRSEKYLKNKTNFLNIDSQILKEIKQLFNSLNPKSFDDEGCFLLFLFFAFNIYSYHFKNKEKQLLFYRDKIEVDYTYHSIILSVLLNPVYNISMSEIYAVALRLEGCIHFYSYLYPCFYFNDEFLSSKLMESSSFMNLVQHVKQDFCEVLQSKEIFGKDKIYFFIAYIIQLFQKIDFKEPVYTVGVYSKKGGGYEKDFCEKLLKSIRIIPYTELCEEMMDIDLLIIDDLKLLKNSFNYKNYLMFSDNDY